VVSLAGVQLLVETARATGLDTALSKGLAPWRKPLATHDPGRIVAHLAMALAAGGDCPADIAVLRTGQGLFGPVASNATVSRLVDAMADDPAALAAVQAARAAVQTRIAGLVDQSTPSPDTDTGADSDTSTEAGAEVVVDIDATLITAHSDKQDAAPTYKRGFGSHPLLAYLDHGPGGTGTPLVGLLRAGNANAGTAADHVTVLDLVTEQLTPGQRERLVIRTDTAGCTHAFLQTVTERTIGYTVGFYARANVAAAIEALPAHAWVPAVNTDGQPRRRGMGGRVDRPSRPDRLAARHAGHRPQRTSSSRRATAAHRRRRAPHHLPGDQPPQPRPARSGGPAPPPGPGRGPYP